MDLAVRYNSLLPPSILGQTQRYSIRRFVQGHLDTVIVLQDVTDPLGLGNLTVCDLAFLHLLVLPSETEPQDQTEEDRSCRHDGVGGKGDSVPGRILLVVKIRRPYLGDCEIEKSRRVGQLQETWTVKMDLLLPSELMMA